ncbi:MAG: hypothetical protein HY791_39025 [Deltaproteobacteria bacterium]|nr:hypothetical protein [Deltaproteobacteria bacterium]
MSTKVDLAVVAYERDLLDRAVLGFGDAAIGFEATSDVIGAVRSRIGLCDIANTRGDLERAGAVEYVADALYGLGFVGAK